MHINIRATCITKVINWFTNDRWPFGISQNSRKELEKENWIYKWKNGSKIMNVEMLVAKYIYPVNDEESCSLTRKVQTY